MDKKIGVGFGVMVLCEGKILLGHRNEDAEKASSAMHGEGTWTMPGGKLHFGESFEKGCQRELEEETGLESNIDDLKLISISNDMAGGDAHFVTVGFLLEKFSGEVKTMEPDEITEWRWFEINNVPDNLFPPSRKVLNNYLSKTIYGRA